MPLSVGFSGRQLRSTLCATSLEHQSTTLGRHPRAESVSASSLENARLICSLHSELSVCFAREPKRVRKRARILVVLGQTCNADSRELPGQMPPDRRLPRRLEAGRTRRWAIHKLATSYPQVIYAQAGRFRQKFTEFSVGKNRANSHKQMINIDKKSNQKMAFLLSGQWISALFVVMIPSIKN